MSRPYTIVKKSSGSQHALVTLAIGPTYDRLAQISHHCFDRYASLHNLDVVRIDGSFIRAAPHFQKLACFDLLANYKRLIFVDADVLIAPDAPNLLDIVPEDSFGAYLVSQHTNFHDQAILLIQEELREIGWRHDYFNSGVMVASPMHRPVFDPSDPDLDDWIELCSQLRESATFSDQTYLNFKIREKGFALWDIGYRFNHSLGPGNSSERFGSHFIHCKGHRRGAKDTEMLRAEHILARPYLRKAFVKYPIFTRLYDRLL